MQIHHVVGVCLVAGLIVFMVGAAAWRLEYEKPLTEALRVIHRDRRRRAWIHLWMIPALFVTSAGVAGYAAVVGDRDAGVIALAAAVVYAMGAVCWVASLAFRLTVVPWAAERAVEGRDAAGGLCGPRPMGRLPVRRAHGGGLSLDRWAGSLYVVHMAAAYAAFALIGAAVLVAGQLPRWSGWLGIVWGLSFLAAFVATRFAGMFNPPFWAHAYTGVLGVVLLVS